MVRTHSSMRIPGLLGISFKQTCLQINTICWQYTLMYLLLANFKSGLVIRWYFSVLTLICTSRKKKEQRPSEWRTISSMEQQDQNGKILKRRTAWPPTWSVPQHAAQRTLGRQQPSMGACLGHEPPLQGLAKKDFFRAWLKPSLRTHFPGSLGLQDSLPSLSPETKAVQAQGVHGDVIITRCYLTDSRVWIAITEQKIIFPYLKTTAAPGHGGQARRKICNWKRMKYGY